MKCKKLVSVLMAAALLAGSLAGCGSADQNQTNQTGGDSNSSSTAQSGGNDAFYQNAQAGIFRVAGGFDPPETAHANVWAANTLQSIADFMHEKLFDYVPLPDQTYMPVLGESFTEEDNKITIKLREGVKWSDGTAFTSKDVLATFHLGFIGNWVVWDYLDSVEAPDDYTVVANLKVSNAITTQLVTNVVINTPYHVYGEWADEAAKVIANRKPGTDGAKYDKATNDAQSAVRDSLYEFKPDVMTAIGTGPYVLTHLTTSQATMAKNDNYWNPENIKINEVQILRTTGLEAQLNLIMSNGYDFENLGLSPDVHQQVVNDNPDMRVILGSDLGQPSLQFNMRIQPMDNVLVRQAIHHLIDRESLLYIAEPGSEPSDLTSSGMIPAMRDEFLTEEFQNSLTVYNHDLEKAEALLTEAGWSRNSNNIWQDETGKVVELEFASTNSYPTFFLCADSIVNQLNAFGIQTTLKSMEASAYWKYLQEQGSMMSISMRPGSPNYGEPWEIYRSFFIDGAADLGFTTLAEKKAGLTNVVLELPDGTMLDTGELLDELLNTKDEKKKIEITEYLASVINEMSAFMPLVTKYIPQKIYNPYLTGFPEDHTDPLWYGGGATKVASRLIREGKLYYQLP